MFAQSLIGSIGPVIVFVGGFIGMQLAPSPVLATLPVACMVVGVATFMWPIVKLMSVFGRKRVFLAASIWGAINCAIVIASIISKSFELLCLAIILFGPVIASSQQYRFAAMESVDDSQAGQAVSILLIAGLIAAFIGPELAFQAKDLVAVEFVGSFIGLSILLLMATLLLTAYKPIDRHQVEHTGPARSTAELIRQPVLLAAIVSATVGYSVMSFIMTATPISMHMLSGFSMADTKWVIQSHIIAMYLPSFFTGKLIARFGQCRIIYAGIAVLLICLGIGFAGQHYLHFWWALVLLGIGWNFMFIAATALLPQGYQANEKFKVQGVNDVTIFTFQAFASLSAGWVINQFGWSTLLLSTIPLLIVSAIVVLRWNVIQKEQKA